LDHSRRAVSGFRGRADRGIRSGVFIPHGVSARPSDGELSVNKLDGCLYDAVADVLVHTELITVLNLGIFAYQHKTPLPPGPRIAVQLNLGVDGFHNFECKTNTGEVLPLVYSWKILSILRRLRVPHRGYEEILKTDAWHDDGGRASYILRCELLPIPAKRESATALP
jgi:hypothetical protein